MHTLNRRNFMAGTAALAGWAAGTRFALAAPVEIAAVNRQLEVKGKAATMHAITVNGAPGGLRLAHGQRFDALVSNKLAEETLIHWHGLTPPLPMDGVPMLSGPTLAAGESRPYAFDIKHGGTHWMHSHVGLQEQKLLAAPFIVADPGPAVDEQDHVVMVHDFTFRDPNEILAELKAGGGAHAAHAGGGMNHSQHGTGHNMANMGTNMGANMANMGGAMSGMAMVNDIVFDAMLANERTLDDPEVVPVEKGGRLRLRIINGAAASNIWVDLGTLTGELIAVDGRPVQPVSGSVFPLAVAQRADIRLALPQGAAAHPVLFRAEGSDLQSGIILRSGTAAINKLADRGTAAPALDLALEMRLVAMAPPPDEAVSRTEFVMLTGGGPDYLWGLNGSSGMHDVLFHVREGERYEVVMHNMTTMAHPMHLHGHSFRVVGINGQRITGAERDTVLVPVNAMVAIQFTADNPGTWAFHCHHMYHMNSGMMGAIAYGSAA